MSRSLKDIFPFVFVFIIILILYMLGIHQLEPYLDHLSIQIVVDIFALFLLLFYGRYLKKMASTLIWNIVRKIKELYLKWNLTKAIKEDNIEEIRKILFAIAIYNLESKDQEKIYNGKQAIDALIKKGLIYKKLSILWIDHEANMFFALVKPLVEDGDDITIAKNEKEAILKLKNVKFDLIILEIIIPTGEKDTVRFMPFVGMRLLEKIFIEMKLRTPIIVLSVANDHETEKKAIEMGVKKFLIKQNFLPSQLKKEIYEVLGIS